MTRLVVTIKRLAWKLFCALRRPIGAGRKIIVEQSRINGYAILVCTNDDTGRRIHWVKRYEPHETRLLQQIIKSHDICFDVGANVGYYTLLMASAAPHGQVHAFEPLPLNYHLLCASAQLNGYDNVTARCSALGDVEGHLEFAVTEDTAYSSFVDTGRKRVSRRITVPVTTLDQYVESQAVPNVDILKVDVEGAEKKVLAGARRLLADAARRPRLIMLELYEPMLVRYDATIDAIVNYLRSFSYEGFVWKNSARAPFQRCHYNRFDNVFFASPEWDLT